MAGRQLMNLSDQVATYVAFKRASGLSFREQERTLADFATWAGERGDSFIRIGTALEWASQASSKARRQRRLRLVRAMAVHLLVEDARHEIPHADALGRVRCHRPPPRLLSPADIRRVMDAALQLPPEGTITPVSFHHIIGLIAATGLRRAEARQSQGRRCPARRAAGSQRQEWPGAAAAVARERPCGA